MKAISRSKSFKKGRGASSCSLPLLLLIGAVQFFVIGKPFPSLLLDSRKVFNLTEEEFIPEPHVSCDLSGNRSDYCELTGAIRIRGSTSEVFLVTPRRTTLGEFLGPNATGGIANANATSWEMQPYTRKGESRIMNGITRLTVRLSTAQDSPPPCDVMHEGVPAVVYSNGGYCGNYYHDFNDNIIPLFITARHLGGDAQLVVTQKQAWWFGKYAEIVSGLSKHEPLDMDADARVHCYRRAFVGLRSHKDLSIDPRRAPNNVSMVDFKRFLMWRYSLPREHAIRTDEERDKRPRLLVVTRRSRRRFVNLDEIVAAAEEVGFEVTASDLITSKKQQKQQQQQGDDSKMQARMGEASAAVNSYDAMLAVHGSGLTNLLFLPMNAVVVQVVPLGRMEGLAMDEYGVPPRDMNMRYIQYNITAEESTLSEMYPRGHPVFLDPGPIHKQSWSLVKDIYLGKQDVRLDMARFRPVLRKALDLLR